MASRTARTRRPTPRTTTTRPTNTSKRSRRPPGTTRPTKPQAPPSFRDRHELLEALRRILDNETTANRHDSAHYECSRIIDAVAGYGSGAQVAAGERNAAVAAIVRNYFTDDTPAEAATMPELRGLELVRVTVGAAEFGNGSTVAHELLLLGAPGLLRIMADLTTFAAEIAADRPLLSDDGRKIEDAARATPPRGPRVVSAMPPMFEDRDRLLAEAPGRPHRVSVEPARTFAEALENLHQPAEARA